MHHALIMLAAGIGIPILAALNARLGAGIGAPAAAATVLFAVAFICAGVAATITGPQGFARLADQPPHLFLAGCLIAFYVLSITWIAPVFGIGNAVLFVLLGQMISAAAIDQFGLFGARIVPLSPLRLAGLGTMALGLLLTQLAGRGS
ncbi:DMT family transporter [Jannaschia sp. 2305UL9-9]|uniref:DMT family transporter n=1 Tax=Jannaschia sp. 2305UL9-9 TaxID=3121638 RepID=UPI003528335C